MGFKVEFNSIVRVDVPNTIKVGGEYSFNNEGSRVYFDDIPIWLVKKDWTAVGEIKVTKQERIDGKIKGNYKVLYLYSPEESEAITKMFKRMYGWK
ncbi:MAG: hypothetical protein US40_C0003G0058 [Candidatus Roizmanbacteria bacterium GW2011_GWC2_37_13]|uniref:Uncharacterized protein n=1 Tax=Candidatus Roizmanbacteria bacterium GW2011_GWC2_37_13 TaxID=1618486 RepID=A0A0G0JDG1_9BACT|nr:MAG: hypothetical protein US38_C0004G0057 [Candidatus Roizmanbacteria bacterium GW2011_GWC1_37_12]KKQ26206.1 MAG: hypothetical protein US40_C0003G0058 [Candidatus Roizmanbacteria bacterium GW2011_GWC2_37_13]